MQSPDLNLNPQKRLALQVPFQNTLRKTDEEIIQYLTTDLNDPLTEDEAAEVLESCRKGNRYICH